MTEHVMIEITFQNVILTDLTVSKRNVKMNISFRVTLKCKS